MRPAGCPFPAEVVLWTQNGQNRLLAAIDADHTECAEYWVSYPHEAPPRAHPHDPPGMSPLPITRPGYVGLHYMAEFHWGSWAAWRRAGNHTWAEAAHQFLVAMQNAGYCPSSGDSWGLNEVPSGARQGVSVCLGGATETPCHGPADCPGSTGPCQAIRESVVEVVHALHDGLPSYPGSRGAIYIANFGQHETAASETRYHDNYRNWMEADSFWVGISPHVRFYGQEVYTDPINTCPGRDTDTHVLRTSTLAERVTRIQDFTEGPVRLIAAAPSGTAAPARSYLGRAYMPLLNAFWGSASGYGNTEISLDQMQMLISEQVYATRQWAAGPASAPDGRIGFGFGANEWDGVTSRPMAWSVIAPRLAAAVRAAYGPHGTAADACAEGSTAMRWCACSVDDGQFQSPDPWGAAFATWP